MRERQVDIPHTETAAHPLGLARDQKARGTLPITHHLDIEPRDPPAPSRADGLEIRFLGREAGGVAEQAIAAAPAGSDLARRKNPPREGAACHGPLQAAGLTEVEADTENHGGNRSEGAYHNTMQERINVNGRITPPEQAAVSPLDRGFLYGDSVYETIRTYGETPFRLGAHLDRLRRSAGRVGIPYERTPVRIENEVSCTVRAAGRGDAAIRIILSRGVGPVNYETAEVGAPTCVIHVRPFPHLPPHHVTEGIDVAVVGVIRNSVHALDPAIKSSNLLNNFMAWTEARKLRADEPILLNGAGVVTEGASSNVFIVRGRRLLTPPIEAGILQGITRDLVLDLARRASIETAEETLRPEDLRAADEMFITSTLKGILPVKRCDGWPVREGRPGPMTLRLMAMYETVVQEEMNAGSAPGDNLR